MNRCSWATEPILIEYHDREWGIPPEDDRGYFEILSLEAFQAGLSWYIVMQKRAALRKAFMQFEPEKVLTVDINALLQDRSLIRNRMKLEATVHNARVFLDLVTEYGSFEKYLRNLPDDPKLASKIFKRQGFKFLGPVVTESFFQAVGKIKPPHEDVCLLKEREDEDYQTNREVDFTNC